MIDRRYPISDSVVMFTIRDSDRRHDDSNLKIIDSEVGKLNSDFTVRVASLRNCVTAT